MTNPADFEPAAEALAVLDRFDFTRAILEGWCIFECDGSDNGPYQLCRVDDQNLNNGAQLESDDEAWRHVADHARAGSAYHLAALALLETLNPAERGWIRAATGV